MIDIHTHVIYGVDDGSRSPEMSQEMLRRAAEDGVTGICCTSHCIPGRRTFPAQDYMNRLEELRRFLWTERIPLELYQGCEIMYSSEALSWAQGGLLPTLAATDWVLMEFLPETDWVTLSHGIREMTNAGFLVTVAHVERYLCLRDDTDRLSELRDLGALCQMNAASVIRARGMMGDRWARRVLKGGMIDVVASDMHNVNNRAPNMGEAWDTLKKLLGEKAAWRMMEETPRMIMQGKRVPV